MTTIVAGGAGFVGSHGCDRLMARGEEVVCLDSLLTGRIANIATLLGRSAFQFVHHDIVAPLPALPHIDRIYHLASPAWACLMRVSVAGGIGYDGSQIAKAQVEHVSQFRQQRLATDAEPMLPATGD